MSDTTKIGGALLAIAVAAAVAVVGSSQQPWWWCKFATCDAPKGEGGDRAQPGADAGSASSDRPQRATPSGMVPPPPRRNSGGVTVGPPPSMGSRR